MVTRRPERGSAIPLVTVGLGLAVLAMMILVAVAERAVDRAVAQTAADMAALAAVYEGEEGAVDLAERNGASLLSYVDDGSSVWVVVRVGGARAEAKAELQWEFVAIEGN